MPVRRHLATALVVLGCAVLTACGTVPPEPVGASTPEETTRTTPSSVTPASPAEVTPSSPSARTPSPTPLPELTDDRRNAIAYAPLDDPSDVTVLGRVPRSPAWSTSKVLVVAAFYDTVTAGRPDRASSQNRRLVEAALTRSDVDAVISLRRQIPGSAGAAMTGILRSIGDQTTVAPDRLEGQMTWTVREQVRFMAALADGTVVNAATSRSILASMKPARELSWGLGTIGATTYKGGWLRADTATRQMGIVDGYAVAIITSGVGPAVRQIDGDAAHVDQLNALARLLRDRLRSEQR